MCTRGICVYRTFRALNQYPSYMMILGDACSPCTESTAEVSHNYNITQLSYGATSPILSERTRFKRLFLLAARDQSMNPTRVSLLRTFDWRRVAVINEQIEFFSASANELVSSLQKADINVISQEVFVDDPVERLKNIKDRDVRIIFANTYEVKARAILCNAYKLGMYGLNFVWIFPGWLPGNFWKSRLDDVNCTLDQMNTAVEGAFLTSAVDYNPIEKRGIANLTSSEFKKRFTSHPAYNQAKKDYDIVSSLCYDHIWLSALALNCTVTALDSMGHPKTLDQFTYADGDIGDIIFGCIERASMVGVSGRISFMNGSVPNKIIKVERIQGGKRIRVANFRQDLAPESKFDWIEGALVWKDNIIPRDSTRHINEELTLPMSLYISMCCLAGIGMVFTVACLAFNVIYRNNRIVKLSSPNINNVLLLGCFLCYTTVFIKTTEMENAAVCEACVWKCDGNDAFKTDIEIPFKRHVFFCFCLGFTLTFGSLFSKTWRVYRIFTNKKLLRMKIKDYQLLLIIGLVVAVVLLVLIVWVIYTPHQIIIQKVEDKVRGTGNDEVIDRYVRVCYSRNSSYFHWTLYIIEGALLTFGAFLAWETRHVQIEALNDSHQIGLCLYIVVILSGVGLTLSLLLEGHVFLVYGVTSACLMIGTFVTEIVVFVPKVRAVDTKNDSAPGNFIPGPSIIMAGSMIHQKTTATIQPAIKPDGI